MDVTGQHDVGSAQPRRRRDDALANAGGIDADHRRVLKNPGASASRQRGKAMDVFAAVDLKRFWVIHAVKIMIGVEFGADAIDLPSLHLGLELLAQHLQPADQLIADIDIGNLQRALALRDARNQLLRGRGPDKFGAFLRQRPEFAGVFETDARDQIARVGFEDTSELWALSKEGAEF